MTDCIFCRIAAGDVPARVVARSEEALAFHDLDPKAPVHVLVIPIRHREAVRDAGGEEGALLLGHLVQFATRVATELGLDVGGYRLVTNTGPDAGQSVAHLHLHLLGGRVMKWPPG